MDKLNRVTRKGTVVTGARGYVFLSGNTATTEDYDPERAAVIGMAAPAQPDIVIEIVAIAA
jgi:hypothetical protein